MYKTLLVVDDDSVDLGLDNLTSVTFEQYLADYPKRNEHKTRIVNLCDTNHYLSRGYYCSLLAEARQHSVLPSVRTINALRELDVNLAENIALRLPIDTLVNSGPIKLMIYFGWSEDERWQKVARQLFDKFPAPILSLSVEQNDAGLQVSVKRAAFRELDQGQRARFGARLQQFVDTMWRGPASKRRLRWDMAILIDQHESHPPSDKMAIQRFVKAAAKVGIQASVITAPQKGEITQYDALFIRETTAIDHHTYRLASAAEREGLVVIDDPTSILRCCNKVFLHDAFTYNQVPSLRTHIAMSDSEEEIARIEEKFGYPVVVKIPEGSFSKGVFKVDDRPALVETLKRCFADTTLILLQEYLYTDYDWRIGVLNGRALYACRYHMARNHWQIYNHASKRFHSGGFETLPTFEVPKVVLDAALQATKMVGNGLYGVDIKQPDKHAYVIEVNDNPNIDHNVEDLYLGNELYMQIMGEFAQRLEKRGR